VSAPTPDRDRALVLYKYDTCPYCQRVFRKIAALGLSVPTRDVNTEAGARQELFEATRRSQVPCLFIDGVPLFESADIMEWLEAYAARPR
jgi:glutaredoxin 3